jgi:hypothetical protein
MGNTCCAELLCVLPDVQMVCEKELKRMLQAAESCGNSGCMEVIQRLLQEKTSGCETVL